MNTVSLYNRATGALQRLDDIYQSQTAQELKSCAPLIIQSFKELSIIEKGFKHEINQLREARAQNLEKFRDVAPGMMQNLKTILDQIFNLQQQVTNLSANLDKDPASEAVIVYTERHIQQLLDLFQKTSFNLLNS